MGPRSIDLVHSLGSWVYSFMVYGIVLLTCGTHKSEIGLTVEKIYSGLDLVKGLGVPCKHTRGADEATRG